MQALAPLGGCPLTLRRCRPLARGRRPAVAARTAAEVRPAAWSADLVREFDGDGDGKLTYEEAEQLLLTVQRTSAEAAARPPAPPPPAPAPAPTPAPAPAKAPPLTWDMQVVLGWRAASQQRVSPLASLGRYVQAKMTNSGRGRAPLSDLVWTFVGMYAAVLALGVLNLYAKTWPVVGAWHQQGLGLLLGSFGTLCVLIFGKPEVEAVRLWNLFAGHVIATFTVIGLLHVWGPCIWSRALAMACMIAAMLFTDSVHPPGGALVLMAVDSHAIQTMDWWFMIYPSLFFTVLLLLPLGVGVNWLKRNVRFDFPEAQPADSVLRPKAA